MNSSKAFRCCNVSKALGASRSFRTSTIKQFNSTKPGKSSKQENGQKAETLLSSKTEQSQGQNNAKQENPAGVAGKKKTVAELDAELLEKLENRSGEGGAAGLEYEGGKAVAMKRGVRENMFRLI